VAISSAEAPKTSSEVRDDVHRINSIDREARDGANHPANLRTFVVNNELYAALLGAVVGAGCTGIMSYIQMRWTEKARLRTEYERLRLDLVREIMRYRLDQTNLIGPLNEVPLLFGDDDETLRLYRETLNASDGASRTQYLTELVNRLSRLVDLPANVDATDVQRGFTLAQ